MSRSARTILTVVTLLLILASLVVSVWLVYLAIAAVTTALAKIAGAITAAVLGLVGTLMAAILNHASQLDAQRKQAEYMAKQDNYKELLSKVGAFARAGSDYTEAGDDLSSAHLASWAFGDQEVLESTNKFQIHPDTETLLTLLEAVRDSLGYHEHLPSTDFVRDKNKYDPGVLFPPPGGTTEFDKAQRIRAKIAQSKADQAQLEAELAQQEGGDAETRQNEEVVNKGNSEESETGNRGHTESLIDAQPSSSPQVDASEGTKMRESPENGAKPDTSGEEEEERTGHPRWGKLGNLAFWR